MFGKILSRVQSFFGVASVVSGVVVDTHHYAARPLGSDVAVLGAGKNERFVPVAQVDDSEAWTLTVEGIDKRGNRVREEIDVPWNVWTMAKIGDKYPCQQG